MAPRMETWASDIIATCGQMSSSSMINQKQCYVLTLLADCIAQYVQEWSSIFDQQTIPNSAAKVGMKLHETLLNGLQVIQLCKELNCDSIVFCVLGCKGECNDTIDDARVYVQMINRHFLHVVRSDLERRHSVEKLMLKAESECSILKANLERSSKEDKITLLDSYRSETIRLRRFPSCLLGCNFDISELLPVLGTESKDPSIKGIDLRKLEPLGKGSFGKVTKAAWHRICVAVKEFDEITHFEDELNIFMNPLLHDSPHIVHLLGHTQKHALVLEFVDQNLNHLIKSRQESDCPFYPIEAVELMLQISKAMRHLHSPNINVVHRDLKPSNVLVKPRRRSGGFLIKLADFGISRKNFQTLETKTDYKGTLVYMAPEMKAEAGKYSRKVDVYSFGLICMEILGEQLPTQYEIEKEAGFEMEAYYVRMGLPKDIPNRLKSLILSCMKYDAENRPSFQEICNSLWLVKEEILIGDVAAMKLNLTLSLPEGIQVASSSGSSAIATSSEFRMLTHGMQVRFQHVQTETYIQAQNGDIGLDIGVSKNPGLQETFKLWKTVRIDNRPMKFRTFIRVLDHHIIQAKFGGGYGLHAHGNNEGTHETFVITVKPNTDPSARNARVVIQAYEGGQYLQVLNNEVAATFVDDHILLLTN